MLKSLIVIFLSFGMVHSARALSFDHSTWDGITQRHVKDLSENEPNQATAVDYTAIALENALLDDYLNEISRVSKTEFDGWDNDQQLAFLINGYNAATVRLVLTGYPEIESIKDLGNFIFSPFRKDFISLFGDIVSLDDIENKFIIDSDRYNDPRIHFALNCASISCPALRNEAYDGDQLDAQLNDQMKNFLADRNRNRLEGSTLRVSKIFRWYDDDFENGWQNIASLEAFLGHNADALELSPTQTKALSEGKIKIRYFDYDWNLNRLQ